MNKKQKILIITLSVLILVGGGFGFYSYDQHQKEIAAKEKARLEKERKDYLAKTREEVYALFADETHTIIKEEVNLEGLKKIDKKIAKVYNKKAKKELQKISDDLKNVVNVKGEINTLFQENILISTTSEELLNQFQEKVNALEEAYRMNVQGRLDDAKNQYNQIKAIREQIRSYFSDDSYTNVNGDVYRDHYEDAFAKLSVLPQQDVVAELTPYLNKVKEHVEAVEAEAARIEEEKRQAAIAAAIAESQRIERENAEIAAANYEIGGIPYISQVTNQVFNGCEAASLLM
ncbi:MAG: hypothetical protein EOM50_06995 [Erysipelotrichia bacterium]|nr:hypothetical protein [Erysipelotrichia bacterium]